MIKNQEILGRSVLILGYGIEGQSVHHYLGEQFPHLRIGVADRKPIIPSVASSADFYSGTNYLKHIYAYDTIVRSPGIWPWIPELKKAVKLGKHITTSTNIFFAIAPGKIIGITGTKGKSTTAALTAAILATLYKDVRLVGNIGRPFLDNLAKATSETFFVAEFSSHQLVDAHYSPHVGILLAIVPEHLDYYPDLKKYVEAKGRLVKYQSAADYVVYNPIHRVSAELADRSPAHQVTFGLLPWAKATSWVDHGSICTKSPTGQIQTVLPLSEIPLLGRGNLENCLAAISAATILAVPVRRIATEIKTFHTLPHRLELVGTYKGITFYNDSLATIPQATEHALDALHGRVATLIVGGFDRGLDYKHLGEYLLSQSQLRTLILFPDTGNKIWAAYYQAARKQKQPVRLRKYEAVDMADAVRFAYVHTPKGKVCLLSPAAASFNLFKNYKERGNLFKRYAKTASTT